jgi:hypothetical protein
MAVLVNSPRTGLRTLEDVVEAGGGRALEPFSPLSEL